MNNQNTISANNWKAIDPNTNIWDGNININAHLVALVADLIGISIEEAENLQPNASLSSEQEDIVFACKSEEDVEEYTIEQEMEDLECSIKELVDFILDMRGKV